MATFADLNNHFAAFARRFVHHYWDDVSRGVSDMSPNEPREQSLDELLAKVKLETFSIPGLFGSDRFVLRMIRDSGETWRFTFKRTKVRWAIVKATAGSAPQDNRVNLLGSIYSRSFRRC